MRTEIDTLDCASIVIDSGQRHYMSILLKPGFVLRYVAPDQERGVVMIAIEAQKAVEGVQ